MFHTGSPVDCLILLGDMYTTEFSYIENSKYAVIHMIAAVDFQIA